MSWARVGTCVIVFCLAAVEAAAAQTNVQFSATAVQSAPDGRSRESQMYIGDNQVRMESQRGGSQMIEIYDMKNKRALLLVPDQKIYMQREVPQQRAVNPMLPPKDGNPCAGMPNASCVKLGSDRMFNRPVSKWEVSVEHQGEKVNSLHWIDDERFMSLRDVWPNGAVSEQTLAGVETLNGRSTERWVKTTTMKDGKKETTTSWYDPELKISVREQLPGGLFRELRDIKIAPQPATLFQVPAGYQRVENETPPAKGQ